MTRGSMVLSPFIIKAGSANQVEPPEGLFCSRKQSDQVFQLLQRCPFLWFFHTLFIEALFQLVVVWRTEQNHFRADVKTASKGQAQVYLDIVLCHDPVHRAAYTERRAATRRSTPLCRQEFIL